MVEGQVILFPGEIYPTGPSHIQYQKIKEDYTSVMTYKKMDGSFGEFQIISNQILDFGQCHVFFPE